MDPVPFPLAKAVVLAVFWENNVIRDWHFMEALDHVPLEAAAMRALCSTYLCDPVFPLLWVSCGYGVALMLRVGACPYAHTSPLGPQEAMGSDSYPYPQCCLSLGPGCPGLGQADLI